MERKEDGILAEVLLRAIPIALIRSSFGTPRIFNFVIFGAVLIFSHTHHQHAVVVASVPVVVGSLMVFVRHFLFGDNRFPKGGFGIFGNDTETCFA